MHEIMAMVRARELATASYRVQLTLSVAGMLLAIIPVYFITGALQPVMAESIQAEGGHYFSFVLVGLLASQFLISAVNLMPTEVSSGIRNGTLEAVLSTPATLPQILVGMIGFGILWTALRTFVVLVAGWLLGVQIAWSHLPVAVLIVALLVLAYLPFGMIGSAAILAFRTAGPFGPGILSVSTLLGGVYYPTRVIPSWIKDLSDFVPLTYGLRALRRILLDDAALSAVWPELSILLVFVVVLMSGGALALWLALRYARRMGTLAQY